ncbi:hypothetical protein FB45DRAFT_948277, partial [Roridomyces roridus]
MLAVSFAFLLVAPAAFAATTPSPLLSLRQSLPTSDDGCESACTALENAVENAANSAKPTAALCTSAIVNDYATCYSCLISEGAMSQSLAQETVDGASSFQVARYLTSWSTLDYVSSCRSAGFSVNGATVSGSSSGGGGSLGDPSIIGGPSVVGSGSSTGRSTATGSVRSGSSVTVTASGAPASSSTARSGG